MRLKAHLQYFLLPSMTSMKSSTVMSSRTKTSALCILYLGSYLPKVKLDMA